jgi:hypothetical protein
VLVGAASVLPVPGCVSPPEKAPWSANEKTIQPMSGQDKESGSLVVETVLVGTENGNERRSPYFLYDEQGRYLTHYPNHSMTPITLSSGRYVVVSTIALTNKRVQVLIREGTTTHVRLADIKAAPDAE